MNIKSVNRFAKMAERLVKSSPRLPILGNIVVYRG